MALLVDGGLSKLEDLCAQDNNVLDVANVERIDVVTKMGLAEHELQIEVERVLRSESAHTIEQVMVNDAVRRWHVLQSLELIYRDAYFSQLNDRYGGRWRAYQDEALRAKQHVLDDGIPLSATALRRPSSVEATVTAGTSPASVYWMQAMFADAAGRESAPSVTQMVFAHESHGLAVRVTNASDRAVGWNLAIGLAPEQMKRQNASPLALDATWVMSPTGLEDHGAGPVDDREPDFYFERRKLWRK